MLIIKKNPILFMACALVLSRSHAENNFTDKGSLWLSGSFSYLYVNIKDFEQSNYVLLSSSIRFFPMTYFSFSPTISWAHMFDTYYSRYVLSIGPEIGIAIKIKTLIIPYVNTGFHWNRYATSLEVTGTTHTKLSQGKNGYSIPLYGGLLFPLIDDLGIQLESGSIYRKVKEEMMLKYYVSIGVCGIRKKTAISFINTFSALFY